MRKLILNFILLLAANGYGQYVQAQYKISLTSLTEELPLPPNTLSTAYSVSETFGQAYKAKLQRIQEEIEALKNASDKISVQENQMQLSEEEEEKLDAMSEEEAVAYLTKKARQTSPSQKKNMETLVKKGPASGEVMQFFIDYGRKFNVAEIIISQDTIQKINEPFKKRCAAIDEWERNEIKKLPWIEAGELGKTKEEKKEKAIQQQAKMKKRNLAEEKYKLITSYLQRVKVKTKNVVTIYDNWLAKNNYSFDVPLELHQSIIDKQGGIVSHLLQLTEEMERVVHIMGDIEAESRRTDGGFSCSDLFY